MASAPIFLLSILFSVHLTSYAIRTVYINGKWCEELHCPPECGITYRDGCPHNCHCVEPTSHCPPEFECPRDDYYDCITVTRLDGCQACACARPWKPPTPSPPTGFELLSAPSDFGPPLPQESFPDQTGNQASESNNVVPAPETTDIPADVNEQPVVVQPVHQPEVAPQVLQQVAKQVPQHQVFSQQAAEQVAQQAPQQVVEVILPQEVSAQQVEPEQVSQQVQKQVQQQHRLNSKLRHRLRNQVVARLLTTSAPIVTSPIPAQLSSEKISEPLLTWNVSQTANFTDLVEPLPNAVPFVNVNLSDISTLAPLRSTSVVPEQSTEQPVFQTKGADQRPARPFSVFFCSEESKQLIDANFGPIFYELVRRKNESSLAFPPVFTYSKEGLKQLCSIYSAASEHIPATAIRECRYRYRPFDEVYANLEYPCGYASKDEFLRYFDCYSKFRQGSVAYECERQTLAQGRRVSRCVAYSVVSNCIHHSLIESCGVDAFEIHFQFLSLVARRFGPGCRLSRTQQGTNQ